MPIIPPGLLPFARAPENQPPQPPPFQTLRISQRGLSAQLARMEIIATNIANAETTRVAGPGSGPYRRRVVRLEEVAQPPVPALPPLPLNTPERTPDPTAPLEGVRVAGVEEDTTPGPLIYDPGHPDADEQGYVRYPNVRVTDEITDFMEARRLYEANASVFQAARALLRRALEI